MKLLRKEIVILKKVSYDVNIVQFYGACTMEPAMLVMEYMEVRPKAGFTFTQYLNPRHAMISTCGRPSAADTTRHTGNVTAFYRAGRVCSILQLQCAIAPA